MVLLIPKDIVFAAGECRHHTEVHAKACRIDHDIFFADVFGDAGFKLLVKVERSVKERGAGTSGAIFFCSLNGCFFDTGIVDKAGVTVGAEHQHSLSVDYHLGILFR